MSKKIPYTIRFDPEHFKSLKEKAKADNRSFNNYITTRLKKT